PGQGRRQDARPHFRRRPSVRGRWPLRSEYTPMEVQVAETGPCSRALTVTVPPAAVNEHLDQVFQSAQQQIQIKGFRPGKVPRAMIEKKFGASILAEAKEQMVNRFFGDACRQKELNPVGRVSIDDFDKLEVKHGAALQFTAKIDVRPVFEIGTVKGLEVDAYEPEANDTDIDNALKEIAHQKRRIQPTTEPAQDGDFVKADFSFLDAAGNVVHARKGVQLNTRTPIHGVAEAAYTEALTGVTAGKQVQMAITFPSNFEKEVVRGQDGKVDLTVLEVLRVSPPPIDDELAKGLEFDDLATLRADLKTRISAEKLRLGKQRQEEQCLQKLMEQHDIALPPSLVEEQTNAGLGNLGHRLQQGGMADEEIRKKLEESRPEAQQDAQRRVRLFFLVEAVARQQKLFVTENDVEAELRQIAAANSGPEQQITAEQVRTHLERENRLGELRLGLLERKVRDFLRENAKIVDKKGS
ncbi:MAG: trigger factor, partial [Planctomycetes bacterium]|nr:trigger factor [Planctomycetota bacterium]